MRVARSAAEHSTLRLTEEGGTAAKERAAPSSRNEIIIKIRRKMVIPSYF
jgi:hypothetical protein